MMRTTGEKESMGGVPTPSNTVLKGERTHGEMRHVKERGDTLGREEKESMGGVPTPSNTVLKVERTRQGERKHVKKREDT
ncbi:hypothetical protein NQZ68_038778 [Dissostichus eleginoides]|nr:hypothetical protein NQZ68_038778 [Dissostichus eleginoides]